MLHQINRVFSPDGDGFSFPGTDGLTLVLTILLPSLVHFFVSTHNVPLAEDKVAMHLSQENVFVGNFDFVPNLILVLNFLSSLLLLSCSKA